MDNSSFDKNRYVFASMPSMSLVGNSADESRSRQIALFSNELSKYNVLLKDLVNFPLKERDRNMALNIAFYITSDEELLEVLARKKDLPMSKISKATRIKYDYLEKCKDYIIAYYIILINPNYESIQDSLNIKLREDDKIISISSKNKNSYKGLAIKLFKRSAYILTSSGEFLKIKPDATVKIGEVCEGKEKKLLGDFKIHISILLVILIMIGSGIIVEYRRTQSIIIIETTSSIKISINKLNKVIYAYSATDKGKELIESTNIINDGVDDAIAKMLEYASDNNMIDPNKKVLITISGQPIKYGLLSETDKVISEDNIPIVINNSGNQQKLPKYSTEADNDEEAEK